MTRGGRAEAMIARLLRSAARAGLAAPDRERLGRLCSLALDRRSHLDDKHPDRLHPARTVLILMEDVGVADVTALAAAALLDTGSDVEHAVPQEPLGPEPEVRELLRAVPTPARDRDRLTEALLEAGPTARLVALAERLDHARHLHLRDPAEWRPFHELTRRVYAPIADRYEPTLSRRFAWWCGMFDRRFLGG